MKTIAQFDTSAATKQCRTCNHKPRHWTRLESATDGIWHEAHCWKAGRLTRPEKQCSQWEVQEMKNDGDE
jgi:hypothetical protein